MSGKISLLILPLYLFVLLQLNECNGHSGDHSDDDDALEDAINAFYLRKLEDEDDKRMEQNLKERSSYGFNKVNHYKMSGIELAFALGTPIAIVIIIVSGFLYFFFIKDWAAEKRRMMRVDPCSRVTNRPSKCDAPPPSPNFGAPSKPSLASNGQTSIYSVQEEDPLKCPVFKSSEKVTQGVQTQPGTATMGVGQSQSTLKSISGSILNSGIVSLTKSALSDLMHPGSKSKTDASALNNNPPLNPEATAPDNNPPLNPEVTEAVDGTAMSETQKSESKESNAE